MVGMVKFAAKILTNESSININESSKIKFWTKMLLEK